MRRERIEDALIRTLERAPEDAARPLHLRTQRDQPYGSMRRSCEQCGVMIWPERFADTPDWTDDVREYEASPRRCDALTKVGGAT